MLLLLIVWLRWLVLLVVDWLLLKIKFVYGTANVTRKLKFYQLARNSKTQILASRCGRRLN